MQGSGACGKQRILRKQALGLPRDLAVHPFCTALRACPQTGQTVHDLHAPGCRSGRMACSTALATSLAWASGASAPTAPSAGCTTQRTTAHTTGTFSFVVLVCSRPHAPLVVQLQRAACTQGACAMIALWSCGSSRVVRAIRRSCQSTGEQGRRGHAAHSHVA